MLGQAAASIAQLQALKAIGVRPAMDDFGTGYASLRQLRDMPVDILNIGKSFVGQGFMFARPVTAECARALLVGATASV